MERSRLVANPWFLAALFSIAVALRVAASMNGFLLDEVWTLILLQYAHGPLDILTFHHGANHILNTYFMYFMGQPMNWTLYRLFALACGAGTIGIMTSVYGGRSSVQRFLLLVLSGFSYLFIYYSAEARGYAAAVFFGVLVHLAARRTLDELRARDIVMYILAAVLALLAHPSAICVVLAAMAWTSAHDLMQRRSLASCIRRGAARHGAICVFVVIYYVYHLRLMRYGGSAMPWAIEIQRTLSQMSGLPEQPFLVACAGMVLALAIIALGLVHMVRKGTAEWMFFATVLLGAPAFFLVMNNSEFFFPRYFLVCFPFFYILLGDLLESWWNRQGVPRAACGFVLVVFLSGSAWSITQLLHTGKVNYLPAVKYMAEHTSGPQIVICTDHDFRNKVLLLFYQKYLPPYGKELVYLDHGSWPTNGPEWVIFHQDPYESGFPDHQVLHGIPYQLASFFPSVGDSGLSWYLYHKK